VYGCVQTSPFVKPLDPLGMCEHGAALSEKQMSLRSNVTAGRNAKRTDVTAVWDAEPA
jgi:hypothetical protein